MFAALKRHRVRYVTVGGIAARAHGAQRMTRDLDICPAWDNENLDRLATTLRELHARVNVPGGDPEGLQVPIDGRFLRSLELGTWRTQAGDLDTLLGVPRNGRWELARYEDLRPEARNAHVGLLVVPVAGLEDLIRSKEIADRPSDRQALIELRTLHQQARLRREPERGPADAVDLDLGPSRRPETDWGIDP